MTKEEVNTMIINGLKSRGIFIGSISPEVLNAFANITYKAINYTLCCETFYCGIVKRQEGEICETQCGGCVDKEARGKQ